MLTEGWVEYLTGPLGIFFAFAAGVISFLSPCVLPLVPAYVAHLTGLASSPDASAGRGETMRHATAFVLGFGAVFTAIGASVGLAGTLVQGQMPLLEKIAGVFLIVLGLNLMGVIRIPWLYRTYQLRSAPAATGLTLATAAAGPTPSVGYANRGGGGASLRPAAVAAGGAGFGGAASVVQTKPTGLSYARSFGFGSSFAVAWTPCIGPVLGAILTLAAASSTVHQGAYLLLAYSAGLALPFLVAAFALGAVTGTLRRFHRLLPALEIGMGAVVVLVGVLVFLNQFTALNQYFNFFSELNAV